MDKLQIAHDLAVAKVCAELPGSLDNSHICQRYFKYRAEFVDLLDSHDEDYFLNELDKEKSVLPCLQKLDNQKFLFLLRYLQVWNFSRL